MTVAEERDLALRELLGAEAAAKAFPPPAWRTHGFIVQAVFFILTCIGLAAAYLFLEVLKVSGKGVVLGIAAIALAEYLMGARRWFATGVEAALWLGGAFALISELPESGQPEAALVIAAAAAIAGWRVRQPLFGALAAGFVVQYFEEVRDLGVVAGLVVAAVAALMLLRTWQRPTTEWLWIVLAVVMPFVGIAHADPVWRNVTIILYGAFGAGALFLGMRFRHHALLLAGMSGLGIASVLFGELLTTPLELKLFLGGAFLLGVAGAVTYALRGRTEGIVATPAKLTSSDEEFQLLGALAAGQTVQTDAPAGTRPQGDGGFGGAGASGSY